MDIETLQMRSLIIKKTRSFFDNKNYLELDTPLLSPDLIPESCLEVFETKRLYPAGSRKNSETLYLIPSPEIWMKKIIAQHRVNIYQICKCFRNGESSGHLHNPEFTMLEYYTMNVDYMDSLKLTEELFTYLAGILNVSGLCGGFEKITVAQAFEKWAGFDLFETVKNGNIEEEARKLGLEPPHDLDIQTLYDLIFIHAVEPQLKKNEKPIALLDYPFFVPCLAKKSKNGKTFERWELYFKGIELANCFTEETDPEKVKEFFKDEAAQKERNAIVKHNVDHEYRKIFEKQANGGFPSCSGVALGLDRLIMALMGFSNIDRALPFS